MSLVYLVDGSNQAFRAFHAMQADFRAPDGFPTRALHGFINILHSLVNKNKPDYVLVVFDMGKSFRVDLDPNYKGHRPEIPEDLKLQWPELAPLCEAFGLQTFAEDCGYEADDIIGTLAVKFAGEGHDIRIFSNDKDFAQLVNEKIYLYHPQKKIELGPKEIEEKWGVPADKVIDILSLTGDKSDNVIGINGVGDKKAAQYVNKYGGWKEVLENADTIGGKTGQRIKDAQEVVTLANQLVQIKTDVDLVSDWDIDRLTMGITDEGVLFEKLRRFGFMNLAKRLKINPKISRLNRDAYELITDESELVRVCDEIRKTGFVSIDLETTNLNALEAKILGVSLCWSADSAVYIPLQHQSQTTEDGESNYYSNVETTSLTQVINQEVKENKDGKNSENEQMGDSRTQTNQHTQMSLFGMMGLESHSNHTQEKHIQGKQIQQSSIASSSDVSSSDPSNEVILDHVTVSTEKELNHLQEKKVVDDEHLSHNFIDELSISYSKGYQRNEIQIDLHIAIPILNSIFQDRSIKKIGQNIKYDLKVLNANGLSLEGIFGDSMLSDYILHVDQKHNLDALAVRYLQHSNLQYTDVTKDTDGDFSKVPLELAKQYAAEDAHVAFLVWQQIDKKLKTTTQQDTDEHSDQEFNNKQTYVLREIEVPLIPILAKMESKGVLLDTSYLKEIGKDIKASCDRIKAEIQDLAGEEFNVNSPSQLSTILFEKRGLKPLKKTKGSKNQSTDAQTLMLLQDTYDDPILPLISEYRSSSKLLSTYIEALPLHVQKDGRVHTSFHQARTETGRLSSSEPNLQNIPIRTSQGRMIRKAFIAEEGYSFVSADYSQIELRLLAHFSHSLYPLDNTLVKAFRNDEDIHRITGVEIAGSEEEYERDVSKYRSEAKAINYGLIYGMSATRLSRELKIPKDIAQRYMDVYFSRYPEVKIFMEHAIDSAKEKGYSETYFGRRRPIYGLQNKNIQRKEAAQRLAMNTPLQGTAADIMKLAMLKVQKSLDEFFPKTRMLLQIHDELLLEVPNQDVTAIQDILQRDMSDVCKLEVPLQINVSVGRTWGDVH